MAKKQSQKKNTTTKSSEPKTKPSSTGAGVKKRTAATRYERPQVPSAVAPPAPLTPAPGASYTPDPRLPPVGTLLQKRDRHGAVRCECTVEESGIRYAGKVYRSLSAAAMAAAKDLGLNNKTQNGFTFWGLSKPPRALRDPLAALERAWERYHGNVTALVKAGVTDANRSKVLTAIRKHAQIIESLREKVA